MMTSDTAVPMEGKARWTRLATLGFVMQALAPILMLGAGLAFGYKLDQEELFFVVPAVVSLVGAFIVSKFGAWAKLVGIVAALFPMGMLFWTAFGLAAPGSFFEFLPGLLMIPGGIIAIVSCIAAFRNERKGIRTAPADSKERRALQIVIGVLLIAAVISGTLTFMGRETTEETGAATIAGKEFRFAPKEVEVSQGDTIIVTSNDPFGHTFTIDELDIDETLTPGDKIGILIPKRAGTCVFYCKPHSDPKNPDPKEDMAGTLTVS